MSFTIIVTVGPSILSRIDRVAEIHAQGPCIFRLNGAHCSPEQLKIYNNVIKSIIPDAKVMIDLPGNKIRTSNLLDKIPVSQGDVISMTSIDFNYEGFPALVKPGEELLANDSTLRFIIEKQDEKSITIRAKNSGELLANKGVHVKGTSSSLPFLFNKDKKLIEVASEVDIDYVSLSFVRNVKDIFEAKKLLAELKYTPNLIAKIETEEALQNLSEIIDKVEIINVDRGDLSADIGMLKLPKEQDRIIKYAHKANKKVFLATQFLKSMENNPIPLISEVMDLTASVNKKIAGIQLSEETAVGMFPLNCIKFVWDILRNSKK